MFVQQAQKRYRVFETEMLNMEKEQPANFSFKFSSYLFKSTTNFLYLLHTNSINSVYSKNTPMIGDTPFFLNLLNKQLSVISAVTTHSVCSSFKKTAALYQSSLVFTHLLYT